MKPNEVVKISLWPERASFSIERSLSASGTFSRKVVSTLSPSAAASALRLWSCW